MRSIGAQGGTARVPAEVMQFISHVRHVNAAHDLTVLVRRAVHIHNDQRVRMIATIGIQSGHVCQLFYWCPHGKLRGGIKRWISLPLHGITSVLDYDSTSRPVHGHWLGRKNRHSLSRTLPKY